MVSSSGISLVTIWNQFEFEFSAINYLIMERGSTIVHRLKVYSSFPDYSMVNQYAKNCWNVICSLSFDHPLSKAISVDEFYSILAYHLTSMYSTGDMNYIFQLVSARTLIVIRHNFLYLGNVRRLHFYYHRGFFKF